MVGYQILFDNFEKDTPDEKDQSLKILSDE